MITRSLELNLRNVNSIPSKKIISNVNPAATSAILKQWAFKFNDLSSNSLVSVAKIDREDITNAE